MEIDILTESVFFMLFFVVLVLYVIMLYNNIILYKHKLNDSISIMLIFGAVEHITAYIARFVEGVAELKRINLIMEAGYSLCVIVSIMTLCRFTLENLNINFPMKRLEWIIFRLPMMVITACIIATPFTGLFFYVDQEGSMIYTSAYDYGFVMAMLVYALIALVISIYHIIRVRKSKMGFHVVVFLSLIISTYLVQDEILTALRDSDVSLSICWAVGLIYFTTNINTERMIDSMNRVASVEADLNVAANIQLGSLPMVEHALPTHKEVSVYATMDPAKEVGGDFFDFFEIDDHHICFVIADVSGKGVPAALFMMRSKTIIKDNALMKSSTAEIFTDVNSLLCENNDECMFATAWIGILDTETMIMKYSNAGHNPPCLMTDADGYKPLEQGHDLFLAGMDGVQYHEEELRLKSGDKIFLYTDGLPEAHDTNEELYGEDRMLSCLNSLKDLEGEELLLKVKESVQDYAAGREQFDDITMMIISIQ
ncbi:MAG: serine/threonine-protein phosphatase [Lachnospiraceae bacterium]|nr:serine/threonine-protein phosphatase [Lachnospiraceae bacterium]